MPGEFYMTGQSSLIATEMIRIPETSENFFLTWYATLFFPFPRSCKSLGHSFPAESDSIKEIYKCKYVCVPNSNGNLVVKKFKLKLLYTGLPRVDTN